MVVSLIYIENYLPWTMVQNSMTNNFSRYSPSWDYGLRLLLLCCLFCHYIAVKHLLLFYTLYMLKESHITRTFFFLCRFYVLSVVILPVMFYLPKFFEVRTKPVVVKYNETLNCTNYTQILVRDRIQ